MSPSPRATNVAAVTTWVAVIRWMTTGSLVGATCTEDQKNVCRNSVSDGVMSSVAGAAGECTTKQYVYFSHLCAVNNYLPNVDHCCCLVNNKTTTSLLCCRYHQAWNYFRCYDTEDVVDKIESSVGTPSLEVLLPCILVPTIIVLACLLFCCVRKCRRSGESQGKSGQCCGDSNADNADKNKADMSGDRPRSSYCRCGYEDCCGYEQSSDIDEFPAVGLGRQNRVPSTIDNVQYEQRQRQLLRDEVDKVEMSAGNYRRIICHYGHGDACCFSRRSTAPPYCSPVYHDDTDADFLPSSIDSVEPSAPPPTTMILPDTSPPADRRRHQLEPVNSICHYVRCEDGKSEARSTGSCGCRSPNDVFHSRRPTAVSTSCGWQLVTSCDCSSRYHCPSDGDVTPIDPPAYDDCIERDWTGNSNATSATSYC